MHEREQLIGRDRLYPEDYIKAGILQFRIGQAADDQHGDRGQSPPQKIHKLRPVQIGHPVVGDDQPNRIVEFGVLKHFECAVRAVRDGNGSSVERKDGLTRRSLNGVVVD